MKKHLKLIIALSITGVILIGAAITFVLAKDIIINKFMLLTKSEVGYFQWVAGREVDEACRKIEGSDQLKKAAEGLFPEKGIPENTHRRSIYRHVQNTSDQGYGT